MYCIEPGGVITAFNIHTLTRKMLVQLSKEDDPGMKLEYQSVLF